MVELRFVDGEWRPARIAEVHSAASVAASLGLNTSQVLTASATSLGVRPSYGVDLKAAGAMSPAALAARGVTDSAGGSSGGFVHSSRGVSSPRGSAERASRAGAQSLQLPPTKEEDQPRQ